jgi:tetratricopeptide (TPR) repeat protein
MQKLIKTFGIAALAGLSFIATPQDGRSQAKDAKVKRAMQQLDLGATRQAIDELKKLTAESPKNAEAHAALAIAYLQNKQIDLAATEAQAAFDIDRKSVIARIARAMVYGKQGNHKDAIKEFEQATKLDDKEISTQLELARYYLSIDSTKQAEVMLYRAQAINEKDVRPYLGLGELYEKQRSRDLAISQYEEAKKLDPNDVTVRAKLAGLYFRNRQYNESIAEWINITKIDESFSQAYYQIGYLYFLADQHANAAKAFQTYTEKEPNDVIGYWMLAQALTENNQFQQALPALEKVGQNDSLKAKSEILLAKSYTFSKEYAKALDIYKRHNDLAPADLDAYGRALIMTADTNGAIDVFKRALVGDTERTEAAHTNTVKLLSNLLLQKKRYAESAEIFGELAKKSPTNENLSAMGSIYAQGGMEAQALEIFNQMLAKDPNSLTALKGIADMYAKDPSNPKMKEAYDRLAAAAEKAGNKDIQGQAEGWIGYHLFTLKKYDEALPHLDKSLALLEDKSPYLNNFLLMTGASHHYQKDYPNARKFYEQLLKRDPNNKSAKDALENLKQLQGQKK